MIYTGIFSQKSYSDKHPATAYVRVSVWPYPLNIILTQLTNKTHSFGFPLYHSHHVSIGCNDLQQLHFISTIRRHCLILKSVLLSDKNAERELEWLNGFMINVPFPQMLITLTLSLSIEEWSYWLWWKKSIGYIMLSY